MHDVVIVLGYSTNPEDPVFRARVDTAVTLYEQGEAPQIIMSGCCSMKLAHRPAVTEAACMRDYAIDKGIPRGAILLEEESVDTLGNFYFSKIRFLEPCSWYHVGIVSTPWHVWRSKWLAEQILGPEFAVTFYPSETPEGWDEQQVRKSELRNRTLLAETREQLKGMQPGDHEAVVPFLGKLPPVRGSAPS
ncbi:MAG TPA: YdcF family protein [Pseudomonadales bacterium]|nr:YdcF family protein [Pseudomonadales bacterium]